MADNSSATDIPPGGDAQKHDQSVRDYPNLDLSAGEYVIVAIRKDAIGVVQIYSLVSLLVLALAALGFELAYRQNLSQETINLGLASLLLVAVIVFAGAFLASYIYTSNVLYLTNESLIQDTQGSLFSRGQQTVSLGDVQNVQYRQNGYLPTILNYGVLMITTVGANDNYNYGHVSEPKEKAAIVTNAVEAFARNRR